MIDILLQPEGNQCRALGTQLCAVLSRPCPCPRPSAARVRSEERHLSHPIKHHPAGCRLWTPVPRAGQTCPDRPRGADQPRRKDPSGHGPPPRAAGVSLAAHLCISLACRASGQSRAGASRELPKGRRMCHVFLPRQTQLRPLK